MTRISAAVLAFPRQRSTALPLDATAENLDRLSQSLTNLTNALEQQRQFATFMEYTRRFEAVMRVFPPDLRVYLADEAKDHFHGEDAMVLACVRYLNLCSEEYFFAQQGALPAGVWPIWELSIRAMLATPLFRTVWPKVRAQYAAFQGFAQFVDAAQQQPQQQSP